MSRNSPTVWGTELPCFIFEYVLFISNYFVSITFYSSLFSFGFKNALFSVCLRFYCTCTSSSETGTYKRKELKIPYKHSPLETCVTKKWKPRSTYRRTITQAGRWTQTIWISATLRWSTREKGIRHYPVITTHKLACEQPFVGKATIMEKSVDTFEQNKRFLSASLRKFKKHLFCL